MKTFKVDNRPSFQFYPDDWLKEPALRLCSLAAQGLWMYMLCLMWFGQPRGTLTANGKQIDSKSLAKLVGESHSKVRTLIQELESINVFSRLEDGTIYCRRMYKKWQEKKYMSEVRSHAGKKGMASRWKKDNNKGIAKITASTATSSPTSTSSHTRENELGNVPVSEMVDFFVENWTKHNKGHYTHDLDREKKVAATLWELCKKDLPEDPMHVFRRKVERLYDKHNIKCFSGLLKFWNFAAGEQHKEKTEKRIMRDPLMDEWRP